MKVKGNVVEIMAEARELHIRMLEANMKESEHDVVITLMNQLEETKYKECVATIMSGMDENIELTFNVFEDKLRNQADLRHLNGGEKDAKGNNTDGTVMALKKEIARLKGENNKGGPRPSVEKDRLLAMRRKAYQPCEGMHC